MVALGGEGSREVPPPYPIIGSTRAVATACKKNRRATEEKGKKPRGRIGGNRVAADPGIPLTTLCVCVCIYMYKI